MWTLFMTSWNNVFANDEVAEKLNICIMELIVHVKL